MAIYKDIEPIIDNMSKIALSNDLYGMGVQTGIETVEQIIKETPTANVKEIKYGEWIHTDKADHWHSKDECSECHYHTYDRIDLSHFNYCPNCGTEMVEKEK